MQEPSLMSSDIDAQDQSLQDHWRESVGRVFKLVSKSYGIRNVIYTLIKGVKDLEVPGEYDIEVACAEITARILNSKRAHSSGCKEGVIHQNEESILTPTSFGEECTLEEFETVSKAIMAHATMNLDLLLQRDPDEAPEIKVPLDIPHLELSEMEISLLRYSPFLVKNIYLLSINSFKAGFSSINQELQRAARSTRLTDVCDPIYIAYKDETVAALRAKLTAAAENLAARKNLPPQSETRPATPIAPRLPVSSPRPAISLKPKEEAPSIPAPTVASSPQNAQTSENPAPKFPDPTGGRRMGLTPLEKRNSIALALVGKQSQASIFWEKQNPNKEGPVYHIGKETGLLEFVRWTHVSGRSVSESEVFGRKARDYFTGPGGSYLGPDSNGIYPLLRSETKIPDRIGGKG